MVYIFSKTDTEYENNLMFFLKHGAAENDGCYYVFVMQTIEGVQVPPCTRAALTSPPCHALPPPFRFRSAASFKTILL